MDRHGCDGPPPAFRWSQLQLLHSLQGRRHPSLSLYMLQNKKKLGPHPRRWDAIIEYEERCVIIFAVSAARLTWLLHGQVSFVLLRASVPAALLWLASMGLFDSKLCYLTGPFPRFRVSSLPSIPSARDGASSVRLPCQGASRPPLRSPLFGLPCGNTSISCLSLCGSGASGMCLPFLGSALGLCPPLFSNAFRSSWTGRSLSSVGIP